MKSSRLSAETTLKMDTRNKKILREVKNDPQYMWKPRMIMADESGANKKVVGNVLGEEM